MGQWCGTSRQVDRDRNVEDGNGIDNRSYTPIRDKQDGTASVTVRNAKVDGQGNTVGVGGHAKVENNYCCCENFQLCCCNCGCCKAIVVAVVLLVLALIVVGIYLTKVQCEKGFKIDDALFGSCYLPSHELLDYQPAVEWCKEHHGAKLVEFTDQRQYSAVTSELRDDIPDRLEYKEFWIAGTYQGGPVTLPSNSTPYVRWKNGAPYGRKSGSQPASSSMNKMVLNVRCNAKNKKNGMFNSDPTNEFRPLCVR